MTNKPDDLQKARQKKINKKVWTLEEIKKRAEDERAAYKKLAEKEPEGLASGGDMSKILEEDENEEDSTN